MKRKYKPKLKEGDVFGHLTAIAYVGHKTTKNGLISQWLFKCSCGRNTVKDDVQVRRGQTKRCTKGCHRYLGEGKALENKLYDTYRRHAIERNIIFNIDKESFVKLTKLNCTYCNLEPIQKYRCKSMCSGEVPLLYNGVDRLDNSLGYTKDNCVSCCRRCNQGKNNMSILEFKSWINNIINNKSKLLFDV